jgi:hypothetical protein
MYKQKFEKKRGEIEYKKRKSKFFQKIIKNIFSKTYTGSVMIFIMLASIGRAQAKMFLKPSYYIDDPADFLGDADLFKQKYLRESNIRSSIKRLRDYGLIQDRGGFFVLTLEGKKLAKKILGYKEKFEEPWDGKYRVVIFDILEADKRHRDWLRGELYFLGYKKLQNSVFMSKFSLTEDIIREIKDRGIEEGVNYLLVDKVYDLQGYDKKLSALNL